MVFDASQSTQGGPLLLEKSLATGLGSRAASGVDRATIPYYPRNLDRGLRQIAKTGYDFTEEQGISFREL
jgi:hypothetical protein